MLKTRVLTGAVLTVILLLVAAFSYIPWVLSLFAACLSVLAIHELYSAVRLTECKTLYFGSCIAAVLISFLPVLYFDYIAAVFLILAVPLYVYLMRGIGKINAVKPWITVFTAAMITVFFKCITVIRTAEYGIYLFGASILTPVLTDIFAYFIGKRFGKHKLAPVISPKKTVEGSIGGTFCTVLILMLSAIIPVRANALSLNLGAAFLYLLVASLIGQFGDLAFSSIKRIACIKDYGTLLPGHGGILDRFDSFLFVLPFTCFMGYMGLI